MRKYTTWILRIIAVVIVSAFSAHSFSYRPPIRLQQLTSSSLTTRNQQIHQYRDALIPRKRGHFTTATAALPASIASSAFVASSTSSTLVGYWYMLLLALQFAMQPLLTQKYAPKTIVKSTYVLAQEWVRLVTATSLLLLTGSWTTATTGWSWRMCWTTVGIPAVLYIVQNKCSLTAYQHLSPITYNVWNQSKTLSAAVFCFLLLGQSQSRVQMGALALLFMAVLIMEWDLSQFSTAPPATNASTTTTPETTAQRRDYYLLGILPVLVASGISGLAGALTQRTLQTRDSLLFSVELACISMTLLTAELLMRPRSSTATTRQSWTTGWTLSTWIPVVTNALGGILVGLVTKHAGAVRKGFALILGMFLSGALQNQLWSDADDAEKRVSVQQWVGGALAGMSLWLHSQYPVSR